MTTWKSRFTAIARSGLPLADRLEAYRALAEERDLARGRHTGWTSQEISPVQAAILRHWGGEISKADLNVQIKRWRESVGPMLAAAIATRKRARSGPPPCPTARRTRTATRARARAPRRGAEPDPDRPAWYLDTIAPPALQLPPVVLRADASPTDSVVIGRSALQSIRAEARASLDGRETGGVLLGPRSFSSLDPLRIVDAGGPGANAVREVGSFGPDHGHDIALEHEYARWLGGDGGPRGHWHTHPDPDGHAPSTEDLNAWRGHADLKAIPVYVGVIATPHPAQSWDLPQLTAWVLRTDHRGRSTCTPATWSER